MSDTYGIHPKEGSFTANHARQQSTPECQRKRSGPENADFGRPICPQISCFRRLECPFPTGRTPASRREIGTDRDRSGQAGIDGCGACPYNGPMPTTTPLEHPPCNWLVRVPSGHPEPDCEADCWMEVECGAAVSDHPAYPGTDATVCENGHDHLPLEIAWAPYGPDWEAEQADRFAVTGSYI